MTSNDVPATERQNDESGLRLDAESGQAADGHLLCEEPLGRRRRDTDADAPKLVTGVLRIQQGERAAARVEVEDGLTPRDAVQACGLLPLAPVTEGVERRVRGVAAVRLRLGLARERDHICSIAPVDVQRSDASRRGYGDPRSAGTATGHDNHQSENEHRTAHEYIM